MFVVCPQSTTEKRYSSNTSTPVTVMVKSKNKVKVSVFTCYCLLNTDEDKMEKKIKSTPQANILQRFEFM